MGRQARVGSEASLTWEKPEREPQAGWGLREEHPTPDPDPTHPCAWESPGAQREA